MAFESLSNRLTAAFKHIVGKDKLSNKNMEAMLEKSELPYLKLMSTIRLLEILLNKSEKKWLVFR